MKCPDCSGTALIKRGPKDGYQRYVCRACGRYCTDKAPKFSTQTKAMAIDIYLNSMGIRAIGRVLQAWPAAVLSWIRKYHEAMQEKMAQAELAPANTPDIIEMDDLYLHPKKPSRLVFDPGL